MSSSGKHRPQAFETIEVWREARVLVKDLYQLAATFPADEKYGMVQQLRRAIVSVTANLAEGARRATERDYAHFINMAEGSAAEARNYVVLAGDLSYLNEAQVAAMNRRLGELLSHLVHLRFSVEPDSLPERASAPA
jgi:four helix bundle protein